MTPSPVTAARSASLRGAFGAASAALALAIALPAAAADQAPIKIGVIAEAQAVAGSSIPQAAADRRRRDQRQGRRRRAQDRNRLLRQPFVLGRVGARVPARRQRGSRQRGDRELHQRGGAGAGTVVGAPEDGHDHARSGVRRHHPEHRQGLRAGEIHLPRLPDLERAGGARVRRRQGHAGRRPQDEDGRDHERGCGLDDAARRRLRGVPAEDRA